MLRTGADLIGAMCSVSRTTPGHATHQPLDSIPVGAELLRAFPADHSPRRRGGYTGGMPKVNVYLPDRLYQEARQRDLPLSHLAQQAIESALAGVHTNDWVAEVRSEPRQHHGTVDTSALIDATREEFGT